MRKGLIYISLLSVFVYSSVAEAFPILPPFKADFMVIAQKVYDQAKTLAQSAGKVVQDSSLIQTTITYGKGAKEALDYAKSIKQYQKFDLGEMGKIAGDLRKADEEKNQKLEEAAAQTVANTEKAQAKIAAIEENQALLRQKVIDEPDNAKEYNKEIVKNDREKQEIIRKLNRENGDIDKNLMSDIKGIDNKIKNFKSQLSGMVSSIKLIASDYDSTNDLKKTVESLSPEGDLNVATRVAFEKAFSLMNYGDVRTALYRSTLLKAGIKGDNEAAQKTMESVSDVESANARVTMLAKGRTQNMHGLINFTEMMLKNIQLAISGDLAVMTLRKVDSERAVQDFNFDNYKFEVPVFAEGEALERVEQSPIDGESLSGVAEGSIGIVDVDNGTDITGEVAEEPVVEETAGESDNAGGEE